MDFSTVTHNHKPIQDTFMSIFPPEIYKIVSGMGSKSRERAAPR